MSEQKEHEKSEGTSFMEKAKITLEELPANASAEEIVDALLDSLGARKQFETKAAEKIVSAAARNARIEYDLIKAGKLPTKQ